MHGICESILVFWHDRLMKIVSGVLESIGIEVIYLFVDLEFFHKGV